LVRKPVEMPQERLADAGLHQEPGPGQTHLAGIIELGGGLLGGRFDIGVGADDEGALAAQFGGEGDARAVSGDPVNEIRRTRGSPTRAAPTSSPRPWTILKTPGGNPA
jgi:hypothetical protein